MDKHIVFIGTGNMGQCLIAGLCQSGYSTQHLHAYDSDPQKTQNIAEQYAVHPLTQLSQIGDLADLIVLAVKPQVLPSVLQDLSPFTRQRNPLLISIAAGITLESIQKHLANPMYSIIRAMPNLGALVQASATGLYASAFVTDEQRKLSESIFKTVGIIHWVNDENALDAVTAVSGSGPAYFFLLMEAMEKAAIEIGLSPELAHEFIIQTALGAARTAQRDELDFAFLRKQVTSPGGTTEKALEILQPRSFNDLIQQAIKGAFQRAIEISSKDKQL